MTITSVGLVSYYIYVLQQRRLNAFVLYNVIREWLTQLSRYICVDTYTNNYVPSRL